LQEVKIALEAMIEWQMTTVEEALQMLSASLVHPAVRAHAVQVLRDRADDSQMLTFLIQLVQCVRHDEADHPSSLAGMSLKLAMWYSSSVSRC
jgi:Phosphoinositide 3-kinase family, accessory domain (PIK domain)